MLSNWVPPPPTSQRTAHRVHRFDGNETEAEPLQYNHTKMATNLETTVVLVTFAGFSVVNLSNVYILNSSELRKVLNHLSPI